MSDKPLDFYLERVQDFLIGLWKFRHAGRAPHWCCTYCVDGIYYDTMPQPTPQKALTVVYRTLRRMKAL